MWLRLCVRQAHADLQPFLDLYRCPPGTQFDLCSAPVLLHCQQHPELLDYIQSCGDSIDNLDFKYLHQAIMQVSCLRPTPLPGSPFALVPAPAALVALTHEALGGGGLSNFSHYIMFSINSVVFTLHHLPLG